MRHIYVKSSVLLSIFLFDRVSMFALITICHHSLNIGARDFGGTVVRICVHISSIGECDPPSDRPLLITKKLPLETKYPTFNACGKIHIPLNAPKWNKWTKPYFIEMLTSMLMITVP